MNWSRVPQSLLLVVLCALVLRVGAAVALHLLLEQKMERQFLIEGDANGYWELATNLVHTGEYSIYEPPRRVLRMPGFPLLLAGVIRIIGESLLAARLVLAVIGALACGLVYLLGWQLFNQRVGFWASLYTAVSPSMVGFSVLILSETLFAVTLLMSLLCMLALLRMDPGKWKSPRWWGLSLSVGVSIALGCYVRPSWILMAPGFSLAYFLWAGQSSICPNFRQTAQNIRPATVSLILVTVAVFSSLLPWAYRNFQLTGHWTFTALWAGPSLYDGLNPDATGDSDMTFFDQDRVMETMTEYEMNQHYKTKAWNFLRENPGRAMQLGLVKLGRFWSPWPNASQFQHPLLKLFVLSFFLPFIGLAVWGVWTERPAFWPLFLTVSPILYMTALHTLFVSSLRYRLPAEYPLAVLAAVGFTAVFPDQSEKGSVPES